MNSDDQKRESETLVRKGADLIREEEYDKALMTLEQALNQDSDNAFALGLKGIALRMLGNYAKASEVLHRAAKLAPDEAWIFAERGEALRMQGRYDDALMTLEQALNQDPDNAFALGTKGAVLFEQDDYWRSLRTLEQALALDPTYAFAMGMKGNVLTELDRYEEALTTLAKASTEDPNYRYVVAVRGQILCDTAYYELALQELNDTSKPQLDSIWTLSLKGWALQNLEDDHAQEAPGVYESALQPELSKVDEASLRADYGRALSLLGKEDEAQIHYGWVIEQASEVTEEPNARTYANVAWCYYGLGMFSEAVRLLTASASLSKGVSAPSQFDIALALMCSGRHSHALREYSLALQLVEGKHVLRRRGLLDVALRNLQLAATMQPELAWEPKVQKGLARLQEAWETTRKSTPQGETMGELKDTVSQRAWAEAWEALRKSTP
jgi:tetratricopeptide (TPR) repeat protein